MVEREERSIDLGYLNVPVWLIDGPNILPFETGSGTALEHAGSYLTK